MCVRRLPRHNQTCDVRWPGHPNASCQSSEPCVWTTNMWRHLTSGVATCCWLSRHIHAVRELWLMPTAWSTAVWEFGRQNCAFLSKLLLYKSVYRAVVNYATTVDEREFSTVLRNWKGRVKVVRRQRTTQTPTSSLMIYDTTTWGYHRRCWLRPSVNSPSLLTGRRRHHSDSVLSCLGADFVCLPTPSPRPVVDDTTPTSCRCVSTLFYCQSTLGRNSSVRRSRRPRQVRRHHAARLLRCWLYCCYSLNNIFVR